MSISEDRSTVIDYIICFAVLIQSALGIMQIDLSAVAGMALEETTVYRVFFTAIPMVAAILFSAFRRPLSFVFTYAVSIAILLFHGIVFPQNVDYMKYEAMRFLLPVVIPSALCLISVKDERIVEKSAYIMSWVASALTFIYVFNFFRGRFLIEHYNMGFASSCLLPMMILYNKKKTLPVLVSLLLFLSVVAIGSRGAAAVFIAYVFFDIVRSKGRFRWLVVLLVIVAIIAFPLFSSFLDSLGISSRTLTRLEEGAIISSAGREELYPFFIQQLRSHQLFGIGLFGDRIGSNGSYCHNLFLEILLDYGVILGFIIIIAGVFFLLKAFRRFEEPNLSIWVVLLFYGIGPYMVSGSYLSSNNLAILIGYTVLLFETTSNNHLPTIYR